MAPQAADEALTLPPALQGGTTTVASAKGAGGSPTPAASVATRETPQARRERLTAWGKEWGQAGREIKAAHQRQGD